MIWQKSIPHPTRSKLHNAVQSVRYAYPDDDRSERLTDHLAHRRDITPCISALGLHGQVLQSGILPEDGEKMNEKHAKTQGAGTQSDRQLYCEDHHCYYWQMSGCGDCATRDIESRKSSSQEGSECAYCGAPVISAHAPGASDDAAWADLAATHADSCQWVLTRAHRISNKSAGPRKHSPTRWGDISECELPAVYCKTHRQYGKGGANCCDKQQGCVIARRDHVYTRDYHTGYISIVPYCGPALEGDSSGYFASLISRGTMSDADIAIDCDRAIADKHIPIPDQDVFRAAYIAAYRAVKHDIN